MSKQKAHSANTGLPDALARPDWKQGAALRAVDLQLDQQYRLQRLRRHLRLVHGWGAVFGLNVVAAGQDGQVWICPGYGIGPCGDEIELRRRLLVDLRDYLWTLPVNASPNRLWLGLEAREEPADDSVRGHCGSQCGCDCGCESGPISRFVDGVKVTVAWEPPVLADTSFDICSGRTPPCPPCPKTCELLLAVITLAGRGAGPTQIENVR